jgi:hypothetical protein
LVLQKDKINKPLPNLTRRREKTKIDIIKDEKGISQQMPMKSRVSLRNTSKRCI